MTHRTGSLLLLFAAGILLGGGVSAMIVSTARYFEWPNGMWMVPLIWFVCYVAVFFAGRRYILPLPLALSSARSLIVISVWIGLTMLLTGGAVWLLRASPLAAFLSSGRILLIWFALLLASGVVVANRGTGRGRALP